MNFRQKNFLISFIFPLLFMMFLKVVKFEGFLLYGSIFVGIIILYFLTFWLLNYSVTPIGFISILLLPVIFFGAFSIVFYYFVIKTNAFVEISFLVGFFVLLYYLLSTQNILNLSYFKSISLAQAAHTTNNFYTILTFFLCVLALFLIPGIPAIAKISLTLIFFVLILLIFVLLHQLDRFQYAYAVFLYSVVLVNLILLYVTGFINGDKLILVGVILGLVFRGLLTFIHYSSRKILSFFDYMQVGLELAVISFLLYFVSL